MTRTIGVTGGIGSGKSTVCRFLKSFGARVFNADDRAKRIMSDDLQVRQEVMDAFGVDSYTVAGRLNTVYLAKEIFSDNERVKRINAIVHPRVLAAFSSAAEMARMDGVSLMVMEAALIYESGADELLDYVVAVDAPVDTRIARVSERDEVSREEVAARMRHQLDPEELVRRADFVIRNDGSLEDLRNEVAVLMREVLGPPPRGGG
ncbi:MAG TPA: dephospho-CoA kinase [Rhodothermia bacterium]|nr:dephospho-CoA kinase [Rhodothermia bacterium]